MSRSLTIGNGNLLVGLDQYGQVRDFYFPYAGHSDHVSGASGSFVHRIGVWVEGRIAWLTDPSWSITIEEKNSALIPYSTYSNTELELTLTIESVVHNEQNVFLRKLTLMNTRNASREVKIFFGQEFRISESRRGDTAFYDPRINAVIHYKGHNAFLVHARSEAGAFTDYSVGLFGIEGREGTYADAEDGYLSKNAIEHGSVDSVIGIEIPIGAETPEIIHYWVTAGQSIAESHKLHQLVMHETPERMMSSARAYWDAWTHKEASKRTSIPPLCEQLYERSLMIMRAHTDNRGGIIASSDTDILNQGRDTYSYVWPRDGAYAARAFDRAGYTDISAKFFSFIAARMEPDGYLMHKYRVDGVLGSSWHPWVRNGKLELPIQEDETASVIFALGKHYERVHDLEFIESLYNPFIEPAADFMSGYIEAETQLPVGSYDLWEEKYGTSTYTAASVYGALNAAADISLLLGKRENADKYRRRAEKIKQGILGYLYDAVSGTFIKLIRHESDGRLEYDRTVDMSSLFGILYFGVLTIHDARIPAAFRVVEEKLRVPGQIGGYMRYEHDNYYRSPGSDTPNAWCITTLWVAQYYIQIARNRKELTRAYELLEWVVARSSNTSILPEQVDPLSGAHLSTAPLVWSHSEFVTTVHDYIEKYALLK